MSPKSDPPISFWSAFFNVWIAPRKIIREILNFDPKYYFWPLLLSTTLVGVDDPSLMIFLANKMPMGAAFLLSLTISCGITLGGFWLLSWIVYISGKGLGGRGTFSEIKAAYLWSAPPGILSFFFGAFGNGTVWLSLFSGVTDGQALKALPHSIPQDLAILIQAVLLIWSFVLQVITVSEAHQISNWKAFWAGTTQLMTILLVVVILGTLFAVFWVMNKS